MLREFPSSQLLTDTETRGEGAEIKIHALFDDNAVHYCTRSKRLHDSWIKCVII